MMQRDGRRLQIALELLHHVGVLPGQIHVGAAEVAIGGSLLVDGAAEIQVLDDLGRAHVEAIVDDGGELLLVQHAGAVGVHQNGDGVGHADGVGQLNLALAAQAGGHQVLGDVAGHVGGGAVHLGGVLAGEAAAAVGRGAAIGVHDDLASGQAGVAHGATHHKAAGGVDVELGVLGDVLGGDNGLDDLLHHGLPQLLQGDVGVVLGGHHDGGAGEHLAVVAVLHGDLALAVGAQIVHQALLADLGQAAGQLLSQRDGEGHILLGLVTGVAEHHALVAGAVSLLVLAILVLLNSPVLDSMRISVNSHMARYQSGKNTPDQVTIYMLEQSGRYGRAALESLKSDAGFMKDPKRARDLLMALDGEQHLQKVVSEKSLAENVLIAPGSGKPDAAFWSALIKERYNVMTCIEKDACVLVEQDLNSDGRAERILFAFNDERYVVYGFDPDKKEWQELAMSVLPREITKEKLLTAAKEGKLGTKPKTWRNLTVDGETLDLNLNE